MSSYTDKQKLKRYEEALKRISMFYDQEGYDKYSESGNAWKDLAIEMVGVATNALDEDEYEELRRNMDAQQRNEENE